VSKFAAESAKFVGLIMYIAMHLLFPAVSANQVVSRPPHPAAAAGNQRSINQHCLHIATSTSFVSPTSLTCLQTHDYSVRELLCMQGQCEIQMWLGRVLASSCNDGTL